MIYYKLEDKEKEKIKRAEKITHTSYLDDEQYIEPESLMCCIEDLLLEIENMKEDIELLEDNQNTNTHDPYDEYGVNKKDFE